MQKMARVCLMMLGIVVLSLSLIACNGMELVLESESESPAIETTSEVESVTAPSELSDELASLAFSLNGVIYTLPVPARELEANGWGGFLFDWTEHIVTPGTTDDRRTLVNGGQRIGVSFFNFSEEALPLNEVYIDRVSVGAEWFDAAQLIFPGNITQGSTYDEVIAVYGEASERGYLYASEEYGYLVYFADYGAVRIIFDNETNLVLSMDMYYLGRNPPVEDIPTGIRAYEAPAELGDDWREFIVKIDGDLYRLPAPVAAFAENGWGNAVGFDSLHARINPGTEEGHFMYRDGRRMQTRLHNYDDVIRTEAQAFVIAISIDFSLPEFALPINLSGGITEKSTIEEAIAAFGAPDDVFEFNGFRHYTFGDWDTGVDIMVNIETGEILMIMIRYRPESLN